MVSYTGATRSESFCECTLLCSLEKKRHLISLSYESIDVSYGYVLFLSGLAVPSPYELKYFIVFLCFCFCCCLLPLPAEFLLEELKALCEHSARKIVSVANVAKMLLAAERYQAETLKAACLSYVQKNMAEVRLDYSRGPAVRSTPCETIKVR